MAKINTDLPIGVFDSGMGGLTVLRALENALPQESFLYLGDTARLPYGTKSSETINRYAWQATKQLVDRGVKCLVIACNTASGIALSALREAFPKIPILGVLEPGAEAAVLASKTQHIAVLATESTVNNLSYKKAIHQLNPKAHVHSKSCSVFVSLAEEGWHDNEVTVACVKRYLAPIFDDKHRIDCLVLGCTHFPVLKSAIQQCVSHDITIIDSAEATAVKLKELLVTHSWQTKQTARVATKFLVTDAPERFVSVGEYFLGRPIDVQYVEAVHLSYEIPAALIAKTQDAQSKIKPRISG